MQLTLTSATWSNIYRKPRWHMLLSLCCQWGKNKKHNKIKRMPREKKNTNKSSQSWRTKWQARHHSPFKTINTTSWEEKHHSPAAALSLLGQSQVYWLLSQSMLADCDVTSLPIHSFRAVEESGIDRRAVSKTKKGGSERRGGDWLFQVKWELSMNVDLDARCSE